MIRKEFEHLSNRYQEYLERRAEFYARLAAEHAAAVEAFVAGVAAGEAEPGEAGPGEVAAGSQASVPIPLDDAALAGRVKLFSEIPHLEGETVELCRVVDSDAEALADLIGNPNVQRYLPSFLFEKQFEDVHEAIDQIYGGPFFNNESLILAIRDKETGELAGLAEFYGYVDALHKASVGVRLREQYWNGGICTETLGLMVAYLYDRTDMQMITASVMVDNAGSLRAAEKAGFIRTAHAIEEDWGFDQPVLVDKFFC